MPVRLRRGIAAVALLAVVTPLSSAESAGAAPGRVYRVVPFVSEAGIRLGEQLTSIRRRLGRPYKTIATGTPTSIVSWNRPPRMQVTVIHGRARAIDSGDSPYLLPNGIRTGSSGRALRRAYPRIRCRSDECTVRRDRVTMSFGLDVDGRVFDIEVSTLGD